MHIEAMASQAAHSSSKPLRLGRSSVTGQIVMRPVGEPSKHAVKSLASSALAQAKTPTKTAGKSIGFGQGQEGKGRKA